MPTYAYACTACDHRLEVVQSFSDDALTECPECGGRLRKVFGSVGVVFKGSGFYRTDSRASSSAKASNGTSAPKEAAKSGDSAATKPAKETTSKPSSTSSASGTGSAA